MRKAGCGCASSRARSTPAFRTTSAGTETRSASSQSRAPSPPSDYITSFVPWRRDNAVALLEHIERMTGRSWLRAIASAWDVSEYTLYGRFVTDELERAWSVHGLVSLPRLLGTCDDVRPRARCVPRQRRPRPVGGPDHGQGGNGPCGLRCGDRASLARRPIACLILRRVRWSRPAGSGRA